MIQLMPTRMVKIIHVIFHILVLGFMTLSYYPIFLKQSRLREVSYHHAFPAFVMYAVYLFQVTAALQLFYQYVETFVSPLVPYGINFVDAALR